MKERPNLAEKVAHYKRLMGMSGWSIACAWCSPGDMPMKGALAVCKPTPTRSMADLLVCWPWPDSESLDETIAHELAHALISPLTSLIEFSDAAVMIEETIVEKLGVAIVAASVSPSDMRAMSRALASLPHQIRARVSALAPRRRSIAGEKSMNAKSVLEAIRAADGDAALAILEEYVAEQLGTSGKDPASEAVAKDPAGEATDVTAMPREPAEEPAAYRQGKARQMVNPHELRARKAADSLSGMAIKARLREARVEGLVIDAATEKRLLATLDVDRVEEAIGYMRLGQGTQQRARSGATPESTTAPAGTQQAGEATPEKLRELGVDAQWTQMYREAHKRDPGEAAAMLDGVKARIAGNVNPWAAKAGKGS